MQLDSYLGFGLNGSRMVLDLKKQYSSCGGVLVMYNRIYYTRCCKAPLYRDERLFLRCSICNEIKCSDVGCCVEQRDRRLSSVSTDSTGRRS